MVVPHVTKELLPYFMFSLSVILLALSMAEIVLVENVTHSFKKFYIQYPTSSLAEWYWIPMTPKNIDTGPSIAITMIGASGAVAAVFMFGWVNIALWGGISQRTVFSDSEECLY
jgi:hypothetical protein